jgi:hypothetical protein
MAGFNSGLANNIYKYYGECVYLGGGYTMSKKRYISENIGVLSFEKIKEILEVDVYIVDDYIRTGLRDIDRKEN